ncbi:MAG: elongation factor P hydroxylase [Alphaproteobacteria bacterium]|nr:elongation factor P hydroxylase [Alphaproteobacteria bacterium]
MILTPIPRDRLEGTLARFASRLPPQAGRVLAEIRATSPDRASSPLAERHREQALAFARRCGMAIHPAGTPCRFNWDGAALDGDTDAYVILHEVAHFVLAPPERRVLVDFGLGPGPDTRDRAAAAAAAIIDPLAGEADEAAASLLGIMWEAALGQPALASFLDQNWLEGVDRSAAPHFQAVLKQLRQRGLLDPELRLRIGECRP